MAPGKGATKGVSVGTGFGEDKGFVTLLLSSILSLNSLTLPWTIPVSLTK